MSNQPPSKTDPWLDCYVVDDAAVPLEPGRARRAWMDATPDRFAYRCLPLAIANSTGWELRCPFKLEIEWDGGDSIEALRVSSPYAKADVPRLAVSHFSHGILTFHTGYLFRTPPGWGIWAMGPPNMPKDGIAPLSGLVETDWLPFPFTMNWKMTRPGRVSFNKGEPFCFITLQQHRRLEAIEPKRHLLSDDPELTEDYRLWSESRNEFNHRMKYRYPDVVEQGWQRHYMRGDTRPRTKGKAGKAPDHITKRRLKPMTE